MAEKEMRVRALKAFYVAGKEVRKDAVVSVPFALGLDLIGSAKAQAVADEPARNEPKQKAEAKNAG